MKPLPSTDPTRWRQTSPADGGAEAEIGAAVCAAAAAPPWDDLRLAHIRQNVLRAPATAIAGARHRPPIWAVAVGCVLLGAAATAMAGYALERLQRTTAPAAAGGGATAPARPRPRASSARALVDVPPMVEATLAPPAVAETATVAPPPGRASVRRPPAPPARAPVPTEPPVESSGEAPPSPGEAEDLAEALRMLRANGDARGALARLDGYQTRHPTGTLAREAVLTRVEALLALGRDAAALEALDGLALDGAEIDRPLSVARAELRAAAGRCAAAAGDFARALSSGGDDAVAARALYGGAVCRLRLGDRRAARVAFETYRRRFPDGSRRDDVERALADLDP